MDNKRLIFPNIEVPDMGKLLKNVTTLDLFHDIPLKYFSNDYILTKKVDDDSRLELLAQELWNNTNYWDVLMLLNNMKIVECLPVNYDRVLERIYLEFDNYIKHSILMGSPLSEAEKEDKFNEITETETEKNEKYRYISYIESSDLVSMISELNLLKTEKKINYSLLIN